MFTVLYRDGDGAETLYSAKTVGRRASADEHSIPPLGPIDILLEDEGVVPGDRVTLTPPKRAADGSSVGFDPIVFVMNKHGATVATYRL